MRLALFGVGSPIVLDVIESAERLGWQVALAVRNVPGPTFHDPVIPLVEADDPAWRALGVVLPLFGPANRLLARDDALALGAMAFPTLIDPTSIVPRRVTIADGVYINAGCVLGAATTIHPHAFINRGVRLGHHLTLGAFASIGPGVVIAGQVTIGDGALVGAGAVIAPGVNVGKGARIGAGVYLRADVPAGATVIRQADTA